MDNLMVSLMAIALCLALLVGLASLSCAWFSVWVVKDGVVVDKTIENGKSYLVVQVEKTWTSGPENLKVLVSREAYEVTKIGDAVRIRYKVTNFGNLGELHCSTPELLL